MFLIGTVDNLVKMITQDTIETALTGAPIDTIIVEDLVVKVTDYLRSWIYMVDFHHLYNKGDNFFDFLFAFLHTRPSCKGFFFLKGKSLFQRGVSKFFSYRTDPFSESREKNLAFNSISD